MLAKKRIKAGKYNPSPSLFPSKTFHVGDRSSEKSTERARQSGSGEENGGTKTEFLALIPTRQIELHARKSIINDMKKAERLQSSFAKTKEPSCSQ